MAFAISPVYLIPPSAITGTLLSTELQTSKIAESHPHGINITKEAPNYSR